MVAVNAEEGRLERAIDIMEDDDAIDIDRRTGYYRESGYTGFDSSAAPYARSLQARPRG
jgi:hypothetical protein